MTPTNSSNYKTLPVISNSIKKIALVDDNEATNIFNKRLIESMELAKEVIYFNSGDEAFRYMRDAAAKDIPQVVFLDLKMPGMNGDDFVRAMLDLADKKHENVDVFMLTSSSFEEYESKMTNAGNVKQYVSKPLTRRSLTKIWMEHFAKSRINLS